MYPNVERCENMAKQIRASHILVEDEKLANKLYERINKGADFPSLAKKHSKCPSGKKGGDLGYFRKGQMVPEFEKAAFELDMNGLTKPVKTKFGYHLIKLTGTR